MNNPCPGTSCTINCTCMVHNHGGNHEKCTPVRDCPAHGETDREQLSEDEGHA